MARQTRFTRKFNGKKYEGTDVFRTKGAATKSATSMRKHGYSARITKEAQETHRASTRRKPYGIAGKRTTYVLYLRKK